MINATYNTAPAPAVAYELKTCELCARNFTRQVGTQIKYCTPCLAKQVKAEEPISILRGRERQKHLRRQRKAAKARAASQTADQVQEIKAAWLKSGEAKNDVAQEIRHAWHLH